MCSNWRSKTSQSTGSLLFDLSCQDPHVELEILEEIAVDCAVLFCSDFASWSVTSFRDFEKWHRPGFTFTTSHPTFYLTSYQAWNLSYYIRKKSCGSQSQWRDGLCFIMGSPSILLPGSVRCLSAGRVWVGCAPTDYWSWWIGRNCCFSCVPILLSDSGKGQPTARWQLATD